MEYFPAPLEKLVEQFARLPGIGGKSAQRLAFYVLGLPEEEAQAVCALVQRDCPGACTIRVENEKAEKDFYRFVEEEGL